jgi:hypothetical protein
MKAPSLPIPADIPCPVVRMLTGNSSLGSTKVSCATTPTSTAASWQARTPASAGQPRTFARLRFVRNWMGYDTDPTDFIQPLDSRPALAASRPGPSGQHPNPRSHRSRRAPGTGR